MRMPAGAAGSALALVLRRVVTMRCSRSGDVRLPMILEGSRCTAARVSPARCGRAEARLLHRSSIRVFARLVRSWALPSHHRRDRLMSTEQRIEHDAWGDIPVPGEHLWGAQTQRSIEHFAISTERMPPELLHALALVKSAAAHVNERTGRLPGDKAGAIAQAAAEVIEGRWEDEFPLAVWQTGSGTQSNMNMNEVLANRASQILGGPFGLKRLVHPNDEVNLGQSSNDVFPTAMHVAAV